MERLNTLLLGGAVCLLGVLLTAKIFNVIGKIMEFFQKILKKIISKIKGFH